MAFRALLVELLNNLSETDRRALHFSLKDKIPGQYQDDCTPSGSVHILDALFDQNLINEENFDYLIDIFEQIECFSAAKQLKEYKSNSKPIWNIENEQTKSYSNDLQKESPSLNPITPELKNPSVSNTSVDGVTILDKHEKEKLFSIIRKIFQQKRRVFFIPLIVIIIVILLIFAIRKSNDHNSDEVYYILKEGLEYGSIKFLENTSFNDGKYFGLTYADRCIGVELRWVSTSLTSVRFLYSNNRSVNVSFTQKNSASSTATHFSDSFMLTRNDEINKINLYQDSSAMNSAIIGMQFRTTNGRKSNVFGSDDGHFLTESFEYYTFGYIKPSEILQFVWIKKVLPKEPMAIVARPMVEICEFTFIGIATSWYQHAKGVECSWYDLKHKLNLTGDECYLPASYYEKFNQQGPQLFAVVNNTFVFYYINSIWTHYQTADDLKCNVVPSSEMNSTQR